jgi:hypothetical protein
MHIAPTTPLAVLPPLLMRWFAEAPSRDPILANVTSCPALSAAMAPPPTWLSCLSELQYKSVAMIPSSLIRSVLIELVRSSVCSFISPNLHFP